LDCPHAASAANSATAEFGSLMSELCHRTAARAIAGRMIVLMPADLRYRSRAVRAMVLLHEEHLRRFVRTWEAARENSVRLPQTDDPAYASLETLGRHVLWAAGGYMNWMCEKLELPDPGIRPAPDVAAITREADEYLEHVLERWRTPLRDVPDDKLECPEYASEWQTRYCIDAMLEHAVMHPIRHRFQLHELLNVV
jgi:hypothetical protein